MNLISLYFCPNSFFIGLYWRFSWRNDRSKSLKTGQIYPRAHLPLVKGKEGNSSSGSQVPSVLWVVRFQWNFPIFSKVSPAWIILAELWNVPWYFYEVSRSSLQTDAERGSHWAVSHWGACFHLCVSESLNGPLIPVENCRCAEGI